MSATDTPQRFTPPPPTSPLDLPEILYVLVQFLDRKSISRAALVCKAWSRQFSPLLFREVRSQDWQTPYFSDRLRIHSNEIVSLEWKKARWEAKRRYRELMNSQQQQQLQQVQQGSVSNHPPEQYHQWTGPLPDTSSAGPPIVPSMDEVCVQTLESILQPDQTRRLRHLMIEGETNLRSFLLVILPRLPTLTCLRIQDSRSWQKIGIHEIFQACQSLQCLDCDSSVSLLFDGDHSTTTGATATPSGSASGSSLQTCEPVAFSSQPIPRTDQLRILRLHKTSLTDQELLHLVKSCPRLEELFLHQESALGGGRPLAVASATHQWNWSMDFVRDLARSCPKLKKLHLSPGCFQSLPEDIILRVLGAFPYLQSLGVPFSQFGDQAIEEIIRTKVTTASLALSTSDTALSRNIPLNNNMSAFTSLDLSNLKGHRLSSVMLQRFMSCCTQLVHFRGDPHSIRVEDMITMTQDGKGYSLQPWACTRLETLIIGFTLGNRHASNQQQHQHQPASGAVQLPWDSILYQQLCSLTKLRRLEILKDGPACTLDSGLGLLSSLSVLQAFRITGWEPAHNLAEQMEAIRWMATTWSCLEELYLPWGSTHPRTRAVGSLFQQLNLTKVDILPVND